MTRIDGSAGGGGPSQTETEPASRGIQPGGFSPEAMQVLDSLPKEQRAVVEQELQQKENFVKSQRQRFQTEIQKAGVLDVWLKDPLFQRFVKARDSRDLPTFFRDELGRTTTSPSQNKDTEADQETDAGGSAADTERNESRETASVDSAVQQRLDELDSRVQSHDERQKQAELDAFAKRHPDYEPLLPAMQLARNRLGQGAGLEDLYQIAKAESPSGTAEATQDGGVKPQQATEEPAASPSNSDEQPAPAVNARTGAQPAKKQATTVEEAWEQSKEDLGIKGPIQFQYE